MMMMMMMMTKMTMMMMWTLLLVMKVGTDQAREMVQVEGLVVRAGATARVAVPEHRLSHRLPLAMVPLPVRPLKLRSLLAGVMLPRCKMHRRRARHRRGKQCPGAPMKLRNQTLLAPGKVIRTWLRTR
jgi:hypothetical protein